MPPRSSLTSSFSVSDATNEVVCPLKNHDGSSCRKRCLGEKRYRSMQEHIRRAHPEHYIAKLPATEESFALMVNTPPSERPPPPPSSSNASVSQPGGPSFYRDEYNFDGPSRSSDELRRGSLLPVTNAAEVLAQLHTQRPEINWDAEQDVYSENEAFDRPRAHFGPVNSDRHFSDDYYPDFGSSRPRELLPSSLARSPPYHRSSTLPPAPRVGKPSRQRKNSLSQNARRPKHERAKSKDHARRMSFDRKAMSAEPQGLTAKYGNRWEDLIEAAASATEEDTRDLTPIPSSPRLANRNSLPPPLAAHHHFQPNSYTASPLQRALTPPPPEMGDLQPFPSVESSIDSKQSGHSGQGFHMSAQGLSDSSPSFLHPVQIYCAGCRRLSVLRDSFACSECICGLCKDCFDALSSEQQRGRLARCPRCSAIGGKFKPFQLDIR